MLNLNYANWKAKKKQQQTNTQRTLLYFLTENGEKKKPLFVAQFPPLSYGYADLLTV